MCRLEASGRNSLCGRHLLSDIMHMEGLDEACIVCLPRQYLLKCRKASKIKGFRVSEKCYYTITTPISNWNLGVTIKNGAFALLQQSADQVIGGLFSFVI